MEEKNSGELLAELWKIRLVARTVTFIIHVHLCLGATKFLFPGGFSF
jgi:hypothetical protein